VSATKCEYSTYAFDYHANLNTVRLYATIINNIKTVRYNRVPKDFMLYPTVAKNMSFIDCDDIIDVYRIPKTVEVIAFHDTLFINGDFTTLPNLKNVTMIFNKHVPLGAISTEVAITIEFRGKKIVILPGQCHLC
jgi:hypothetical protein